MSECTELAKLMLRGLLRVSLQGMAGVRMNIKQLPTAKILKHLETLFLSTLFLVFLSDS